MSNVIEFPELGWIGRGPYPVPVTENVPTTLRQAALIRKEQARLGIAVDGILGPATWVTIGMRTTDEP